MTVTDAERKFINNLAAQDFQVFEDGIQQPVSFFGVADVPLDVALLVDGSASMLETLPMARNAAIGLVRTLRPQDRASLVEFRNTVRVSQAMTGDIPQVVAAIDGITASGGTSLYNALYVTLKDFQKLAGADAGVRRRTIVVLSDGEDTGSLIGFDEVLDLARRSGVTIYTVALKSESQILRQRAQQGGRRYFSQADYSMRALAEETGARAFFPDQRRRPEGRLRHGGRGAGGAIRARVRLPEPHAQRRVSPPRRARHATARHPAAHPDGLLCGRSPLRTRQSQRHKDTKTHRRRRFLVTKMRSLVRLRALVPL